VGHLRRPRKGGLIAGDDNDKDRRSAASELVDIARSTYELGISTEGLAFGH
jgi:hypothetical protein